MSSTNKTTYYGLPQFVDNDIFNPLVDDNDAYSNIDTALHNIANAEADDASDIVGIKSRLVSAEGDIDALEAQNGNSVLTTTAQTLSGAVNELDADVSDLDGRLDIVEDDINNASTGLKAKVTSLETQNGSDALTTTAQTLSGAINELDGEVSDLNSAIGNPTILTENDTINNALLKVNQKLSMQGKISHKPILRQYRYSYFPTITGDSDINYLQGMAYDSKRDRILLIAISGDDAKNSLVLLDGTNPNTVIMHKEFSGDFGHGNPMAYDSVMDRFVAVVNNNVIKTVSPTTLDIIETINLPISGLDDVIHGVAYDNERNCFYGNSYLGIYTFSSDFDIVEYKYFEHNIFDYANSAGGEITKFVNGFDYHNNKFYVVVVTHGNYSYTQVLYEIDETCVIVSATNVNSFYCGFEVEDITFMGDKMIMASQGDAIGIDIIYEMPYFASSNSADTGFGLSLTHNNNIDLDAFDDGVYCITNEESLLMNNLPMTGAIILITDSNNGGLRPEQIMMTGAQAGYAVARRSYNRDNGLWSAWSPFKNMQYIVHNMDFTISGQYLGMTNGEGVASVFIPDLLFVNNNVQNTATTNSKINGAIIDENGSHTIANDSPIQIQPYGNGLRFYIPSTSSLNLTPWRPVLISVTLNIVTE